MNSLPVLPTLRVAPISRIVQAGKWHTDARRSWGEPVLYWFTRGQGRLSAGGEIRGYGPHNAIFLPAETVHGFEAHPQVFGSAVFFGRNHGLPLPFEPLHIRARETPVQMELNQLIDHLARELDGLRPGREQAAQCWLGLICVWMERQALRRDDRGDDPERQLVARYVRLLDRAPYSRRDVADFAHDLGVTSGHLSRACHAAAGRSAHTLLHDRLIIEARRLLAEQHLPVVDVARALGFSSPAYFTRAFHQRTGKSPAFFCRNG